MGIENELDEETKIFLIEGYENLEKIERELLSFEKNPTDTVLLDSIFRAMHTIKGNSGFFSFQKLGSLCHKGETLLDKIRDGGYTLTPDIVSTLLSLVDAVRTILTEIESSGVEPEKCYEELEAELNSFVS